MPPVRVMLYAPDEDNMLALEHALDGVMLTVALGTQSLVAALTLDPPPRPQVLVIDVESMSGADLLELHRLRDNGWFGTIIAVGAVPETLRRSLRIDTVLVGPAPNMLRAAIARVPFEACTTKIPVMR
jgi:hypothetical protein